MIPLHHPSTAPHWRPSLASLVLAASLSSLNAMAGPGAHGPNGEHLDSPGTSAAADINSSPRLEAHSDLFELVATLHADQLSLLIHRFQTNEPVLRAEVELETGGVKAQARFHAEQADFVVNDAAFLKALSSPGPHALVITVRAGSDADLLDGTMAVGPQALAVHAHAAGAQAHPQAQADGPAHEADHGQALGVSRSGWAGLATLLLGAAAALVWWRRRRPPVSGTPPHTDTKPGSTA